MMREPGTVVIDARSRAMYEPTAHRGPPYR
jgi:hypothetical protein